MPTEVAEGRAKKKRGTAIARTPEAKEAPKTTAAPAAQPKGSAKPATANASASGFSLTPSIRSPLKGSCDQPVAFAGTTSVWPMSKSVGAFLSLPAIRVMTLTRPASAV